MKAIRASIAIAAAGLTAACGGSSPTASDGVSSEAQTAAQGYQAAGADMSTTIAQYQSAAATTTDATACQAAETTYQAEMGPLIDRMTAVSSAMDQHMSDATRPGDADMGCVAAAMKAELARHAADACTLPDVAADQAEAAQHAATMAGWVDHQRTRYEQMGEATGMMPPTDDDTWTCTQNADGTFTLGGSTWEPHHTPPAQTPTATPTPIPTPWPMPCGGSTCPCDDSSGHPHE
jgi:hypothetical protein